MRATRPLALVLLPLLGGCMADDRPAPQPSAPPTDPLKVEDSSDLIDFGSDWPPQVEAHAGLRRHFQQQLAADRKEAEDSAREDQKARKDSDVPYMKHDFHRSWALAGETPQLLSFVSEIYRFDGGAHGNTLYGDLLWDVQADHPVARGDVLPPALLQGLTPRYCAELDRQRAEKRGEPTPADKSDPFDQCPPLAEQTIAPVDSSNDGKFDTIGVTLAPYAAGPYSEGSYELDLPIDAATLAQIPEAWRPSFQVRAK